MEIREHEALAPYTTFRVPATCSYFCDVASIEDLTEAVEFAKKNNSSICILGGGSNTLFLNDFNGLVARISIRKILFEEGGVIRAHIGAGENWDMFVKQCVAKGFWGIENLSYIPGSVGGAVVQNIGAYGTEFNQVVESVEVFDLESLTSRTLSNTECAFSYRTSIFKTPSGKKYVVLGVTIQLKKQSQPNLSYKDVADYFKASQSEPTLGALREAVIEIRRRKLPDVSEVGTAGSFFKNPIVEKLKYLELKNRFPDIPSTIVSDGLVKISAAWMLDHIGGFRGIRRGDAGVWQHQALALVNFGTASGEEILSLANEIKEKIKKETGIELEREVVIV